MPILSSQSIAAGRAAGLKKVRGILNNRVGGAIKALPGESLESQPSGVNSTNILSYPLDVTAGPGLGNQGHYMMFFINEQADAEVRFGNRTDRSSFDDSAKSREEGNIPEYIREFVGDNYIKRRNTDGQKTQQNLDATVQERSDSTEIRGSGSTVYVERAPTVRLDTAIALYMPPQATFVNNANYTDTEIGAAASAGVDFYADIMAGGSAATAAGAALNQLGESVSEGLTKTLLATVGALPGFGGAREAYEMATGVVIADRMELAFKGIAKRKFQFNFKMMPKNQQEADEIRKIIFAFRANMLPEFVGGNRAGRKLRVPNTFDIQYMFNGQENNYLQKISTCVLENVTVVYGGDKFRTFSPNDDGAPPVETDITLNFAELELITKERVFEGY